jgi:potassium large conductance calcium-activated channel subfamily M alpha protein 1
MLSSKTTVVGTNWLTNIKDFCGEMISGQSTSGRILMIIVFFLSIGSLIIYFIDVSLL